MEAKVVEPLAEKYQVLGVTSEASELVSIKDYAKSSIRIGTMENVREKIRSNRVNIFGAIRREAEKC